MSTAIPSTMRASQWSRTAGGLEKNLSVNASAPLPAAAHSLGTDQTLVKVYYSSVNPIDFKLPELPIVGSFLFTKPAIPSMDYAGRVVSTTRSDLKPGQLVFGATDIPAFGALAEYLVVGRQGAVPVPAGVALKDAACIGVAGLTAYQCIAPFVQPGSKIFINGGTGGTGSFGVQIAKALGCYVVASCSGANAELCKRLGADEVVDYRAQDVAQTLQRKGTQFDHIVDFAASAALYYNAHHYLKAGGQVVNVGGDISISAGITLLKIFLWPAVLGGGQRKYQFLNSVVNAAQYVEVAQLIADGKVKPLVAQVFELEEAPQAYQKLKAGGFQGKLVVKVSEEES